MPKFVGVKLKFLRRQLRLTQVELADQLLLASRAYLSNVESGREVPSLGLVVRAARRFGVPTDYLLRDHVTVEDIQPRATSYRPEQKLPTGLLGSKLRYLRQQQGQTQIDMARMLGLRTHAQISHIESGRHEPSIDLILRIADTFATSTDYLLNDEIPVVGEQAGNST